MLTRFMGVLVSSATQCCLESDYNCRARVAYPPERNNNGYISSNLTCGYVDIISVIVSTCGTEAGELVK